MTDKSLNTALWTTRSVEDTVALYRDWAATYDADVLGSGYVTPIRAAAMLAQHRALETPVLDFGCGTGLSGKALAEAGFACIDGTDITPEMLALAEGCGAYRRLWLSQPGEIDIKTGAYRAILASGVVSLGAAPPPTLALLVSRLAPDGLLVFSYNDPTLQDAAYMGQLQALIDDGTARLVAREHGPHLPYKGLGSEVIVLSRR